MSNLEQKKFPIGQFQQPEHISDTDISDYIKVIEDFPKRIKLVIADWSDEQLDTPYREGGWTVR
ncbi:hypothetical protein VUJ46_02870 [Chryseobacterium sp. MYb264]|uniref:hypothetical protein n=1 Tax=Chryseobacterium sp. MYb264 TaxID=2745153 RepID=UPI002E15C9A1|nr:hypothetical protein VUJ46_02870 [Chryseobacterium sp. MYb264]